MGYKHKRKPDVEIVFPEPLWGHVIDKLRTEGYSMSGLARMCGTTRQRLYTVWEGIIAPEWYTGQVLIQLHQQFE